MSGQTDRKTDKHTKCNINREMNFKSLANQCHRNDLDPFSLHSEAMCQTDAWDHRSQKSASHAFDAAKKHIIESNLRSSSQRNANGHVEGIGNVSFFMATPYATASASMSLYGGSPVRSSHRTIP